MPRCNPYSFKRFEKFLASLTMICVIACLVLTIAEMKLNTQGFDHGLTQPPLPCVSSPLFPFSFFSFFTPSFSCFPVSPLSVRDLPSTRRTCKHPADCFLFSASLICTAPLSRCIIYVCHYSSLMRSQISLIFPCDFSRRGREAWSDRC